jgi:hypothetical protein
MRVLLRTLWPKLSLNASTATVVVGIFGTHQSLSVFLAELREIEDMRFAEIKAAAR